METCCTQSIIDSLIELEVRQCCEYSGHRVLILVAEEREKEAICHDIISVLRNIQNEHFGGCLVNQYKRESFRFKNGGIIDIYNANQIHRRTGRYHSALISPFASPETETYIKKFMFPSFHTIARMRSVAELAPCTEEEICTFLGINPEE